MATREDIEALEARLIEAMKSSNTPELEVLIADNLIFTNHLGHLLSKQADIDVHKSGDLEIFSIDTSAQLIELYENMAIVSVVKDMSVAYAGHMTLGLYRFTRVWHHNGTQWQVIAAHSSQVSN
jgi:hypothetical protein